MKVAGVPKGGPQMWKAVVAGMARVGGPNGRRDGCAGRIWVGKLPTEWVWALASAAKVRREEQSGWGFGPNESPPRWRFATRRQCRF